MPVSAGKRRKSFLRCKRCGHVLLATQRDNLTRHWRKCSESCNQPVEASEPQSEDAEDLPTGPPLMTVLTRFFLWSGVSVKQMEMLRDVVGPYLSASPLPRAVQGNIPANMYHTLWSNADAECLSMFRRIAELVKDERIVIAIDGGTSKTLDTHYLPTTSPACFTMPRLV
eukprot:PhM_4_TR15973/c1_g3_i9/m.97988